jgi:hypothetical protein
VERWTGRWEELVSRYQPQSKISTRYFASTRIMNGQEVLGGQYTVEKMGHLPFKVQSKYQTIQRGGNQDPQPTLALLK